MTQAPASSQVPDSYRYLFGPVQSRRLGRSLGIDLLPLKTCNLDCVYCECGPTTNLTSERNEWVPTADVLAELDAWLGAKPELDWVTFSGSGEPTLHSGIGTIIGHLKAHHPGYKVAVLTNGTLLGRADVAQELRLADLVVPSLDSAVAETFRAVCRPHSSVDWDSLVGDLGRFREGFPGTVVLETFLVSGLNDTRAEIQALKSAAERIRPLAVQLNTLDRHGTDGTVTSPGPDEVAQIRDWMAPFPVQLVRRRGAGEWTDLDTSPAVEATRRALVQQGSLSVEALALALGIRPGDCAKLVQRMAGLGLVTVESTAQIVHLST